MLAFAGLFFAAAAVAEPMPALAKKDRSDWLAIGRVNGAGVGKETGCTGTLIAPDLVLTAAHCAGKRLNIPLRRHFIAGWDSGAYVAHRLSASIHIHPAYEFAQGAQKFVFDIALLQLDAPIDPDVITPIALAPASFDDWQKVALLGYHNRRPEVVNARFDCPVLNAAEADVLFVGCEVIGGNSGGPVLIHGDEGWQVGAVLVARTGDDGHALAVPLDAWAREHWNAALERAEAYGD